VRAAFYELPVMLAIIGADPARFQPYVELMAKAAAEMNKPSQAIGVHSPGHVARTDEEAAERFWPFYKAMHDQIGAERGWPPMQRQDFQREIESGSLYVGSAETVARKIARTITLLRPARFQLKYSAGELPHSALMDCIERFAGEVAPRVRDLLETARYSGDTSPNISAVKTAPTA
jgi:alkanesulfonate monooxygenase SsuD/methylene tetrahydromethanopterin reductase-like flavin-dependent oxidoreductase (luciferase family)